MLGTPLLCEVFRSHQLFVYLTAIDNTAIYLLGTAFRLLIRTMVRRPELQHGSWIRGMYRFVAVRLFSETYGYKTRINFALYYFPVAR